MADGGDALEVGGGVADVLVAGAVDGGDGGGAEAEVVVPYPVAVVVAGALSGKGKIGCFVVVVAGLGEEPVAEGEHFGVEVGVVLVGAFLKLVEEGGVFFIGEIVGRDVVGLGCDGFGDGVFPVGKGLAGDGEDEVDVDFK